MPIPFGGFRMCCGDDRPIEFEAYEPNTRGITVRHSFSPELVDRFKAIGISVDQVVDSLESMQSTLASAFNKLTAVAVAAFMDPSRRDRQARQLFYRAAFARKHSRGVRRAR